MTPRLIAGATLVALLLAGNGGRAEEPLKSGPPAGARNNRGGFYPQFVAGPGTGERRCPVWTPDTDLVALIFVNEVSEPLTSLVKKIDRVVDEVSTKRAGGQNLGVFVIIGDAEGRADQLRALAKKESLTRVSFCIGTAPPRYEVNKEADITVVIYTVGRPGRQEVTANFALRTGDLGATKRDDIVVAVSKVLPK